LVSIVIPVKNGGDDLVRCLGAIQRQHVAENPEILVVDSGSTDRSVEVARRAGARVIEIPPEEFGHGRTRNLAASAAKGEILVFISQDAEPVGTGWLESLTTPLADNDRLAGVYGRQVAREDAVPPEHYFLDFVYGPEPRVQALSAGDVPTMETTLFSNANAAIRRAVWEEFPFADDLIMSEDQDWSRRALTAGWTIAYEPRAVVCHSHPYTLAAAFRRFFDSGVSSERAYLAGEAGAWRVLAGNALRYIRNELRWLVRMRRARWIPYTVVYEAAKLAGLLLGSRHRWLPLALKRRMSGMPSYWTRTERRRTT
jgi:rhamnosyltransferase